MLLLLLAVSAQAVGASYSVEVPIHRGGRSMRVTADVGSASSFRLTVDFQDLSDGQSAPLDSPSLDANRSMALYTHTSSPEGNGIKTHFGELLIRPDGRFILKDAAGTTISAATESPQLTREVSGHQSITMSVSGSKTGPGATGRRPCLANGNWGAPFTWDPVDKYFAFAVSAWEYDPELIHCYPVSFDGGSSQPLPPAADSCTTFTHVIPFNNISQELAFIQTAASGGDGNDTCCNACNGHPACTAWMFDNDAAPDGLNCHLYSCVDHWIPPDVLGESDDRFFSGGLQSQCAHKPAPSYIHQAGWWGLGARLDWYLAPTPAGGLCSVCCVL